MVCRNNEAPRSFLGGPTINNVKNWQGGQKIKKSSNDVELSLTEGFKISGKIMTSFMDGP